MAGLTAVLVGYLTVWLPGPSAGLSLIGVEIGEWIKFLGVGSGRNLFYLPPIALGLVLALLTVGWGAREWRAWAMRGLAAAVSLLAIPAVAAIQMEPQSEWLLRVALVGLVAVVALLCGLAAAGPSPGWALALIAAIALLGAFLPVWEYFVVKPVVERILLQTLGIGVGVWLNSVGFVLIAAVALLQLAERRKLKTAGAPG